MNGVVSHWDDSGRVSEHNGRIPRDFWLTEAEKQAILDFHDRHLLEGYRRRTFMMLDADHWGIENRSNVRDVTLGEDASHIAKGNAPHVFASLRNAVVTYLRRDGASDIAAALPMLTNFPNSLLNLAS